MARQVPHEGAGSGDSSVEVHAFRVRVAEVQQRRDVRVRFFG